MEQAFDSVKFVNSLAEELIFNFGRAGSATTPTLVSSVKEHETRRKLQSVLPSFLGVGTGCVIDSYGHTSKQTDVVLYEKDICPVFSINNTHDTTYYPCEGVIAVGEIKSTLDSKELKKAFDNIKSIKEARRFNDPARAKGLYRNYGLGTSIQGIKDFDQKNNFSDQIFSFILCEKIGLKVSTFLERYCELCNSTDSHLLPNITISLTDGVFVFYNKNVNKLSEIKKDSTGVYNIRNEHGDFAFLLFRVNEFTHVGRTSFRIPYERYVLKAPQLTAGGNYRDF
jgi:hypothetical protein